ncbi:uncharacterized protein LDX57_010886 [Aspergillus melleus]|uniref:uncharacterized protein n=1 Tax=Aspergillus melleus TaxID=138277 RepID=UPI001E8EE5E0|nr:uncharacterized protein LDX57_010886 [Aspergillus melleus]KAH8433251.1 hypothetical protein LDX57_010886 [Aspergillus melleus]
MLPRLLATQVEIQNSMLAHYYTAIYNYSQEEKFPSPPLPMEQIVLDWQRVLLPVQEEVEGFGCLANGKVVRQQGTDDSRNGSSHRPGSASNGAMSRRRSSGQLSSRNTQQRATSPAPKIPAAPSPAFDTKPRLNDVGSLSSSLNTPSTHLSPNSYHTPASERRPSSSAGLSPASARTDYFGRNPTPSGSGATSPGYSVLAAAVGKKKPPPPPKPRAASNQAMYVTALYDFGGQSAGDLAFQEGDRIRVIEKTDSTDDWWEGELRGVKGSFPANYVE